jgi:histidinol-phosphate aminotransferase
MVMDRRRLLATSFALAAAPHAGALRAAASPARMTTDTLRLPLRLSGNENPWGPGPAARAAIAAAVDESCRYGTAQLRALTEAIARHEGVERDRIVIGSGSGELLQLLALAWCERGEVVCAWPTFNQLMSYAERFGAAVRKVPLDAQLRHDLPALLAATGPNTSLLYLCNPNNPTGTVVAGDALSAACREAAARTLVVVDEAYLDLADPARTASMLPLVRADANVVVLRTFSKIHGLAGLRIGYALARPDVAQRLRRHQMTLPNTLGLAAAAASLQDRDFLARTRAALLADRARVCAACDELGLRYADSEGNFVFVQVGMPVETFAARMREQQVEVGRPFEPYADWCRISIGTTTETDFLITALRRVLRRN